jgi:hypothetical protein
MAMLSPSVSCIHLDLSAAKSPTEQALILSMILVQRGRKMTELCATRMVAAFLGRSPDSAIIFSGYVASSIAKLRRTQHEHMPSGLPLKADIARSSWHVSNVPKAPF